MEKNVRNSIITRSNFLRVISLSIVIAFLFSLNNTNGQGSKANFAGNWTFNAAKSTQPAAGGAGGAGRGGFGGSFVATQDANLLTRTTTSQDGTKRDTKYTLDGKESVNTTRGGEAKSVATWSADGKTLTIVTTRTTDNGVMKTSEAWSMPDAKTLSIVSTSPGRNGGAEVKRTMIYDKK